MENEVEAIAQKIAALDAWRKAERYCWAIKVHGVAFPYFCVILPNEGPGIKANMMMLEGWQTFYDYLKTKADNSYGFYSIPSEFTQFAMVPSPSGGMNILRSDTGFVPRKLNESERKLCAKLFWQAYGVILRLESGENLPAGIGASDCVFARVEGDDGAWRDETLALTPSRPYIEKISFRKDLADKAASLPFAKDEAIAVDLRILSNVHTNESRPRIAYGLIIADSKTAKKIAFRICCASHATGLKELWESLASKVLSEILVLGKVPGEICVSSARVFRLLRPLCNVLPFKLSLHDSISALDAIYRETRTTDINSLVTK